VVVGVGVGGLLNGEQRGEERGGAQDEREAGPGAGLQRYAQDSRGEAAPLLGGGGRRVPADQLGPAPQPRGVGWRWVGFVCLALALLWLACSGRAEWDPDLDFFGSAGFGWVCGWIRSRSDLHLGNLACFAVSESLLLNLVLQLARFYGDVFFFTPFHSRKFSCGSLVPF